MLIIVSSVLIGLDWPGWHRDFWLKQAISYADIVCGSAFMLECLLKVVTLGFVYSRDPRFKAYLSSGWNRLDFFVVCITIVSLGTASLREVAAIRALRAFRAVFRRVFYVPGNHDMCAAPTTLRPAAPAGCVH